MKKSKVIGSLLAFGALVASGITFSGNFNGKNTNYIREGVIDDNHYREAIYDTGVRPSKLQIMEYSDYTQQPTGDQYYNTQKNYHLNSLNLGNTWNTYRGDGVTVAVIDTGINYSHNDFVYYNTSGTSISDLSADFEDPNATGTATKKTVASYGWSVMIDANGHGTNVASTIASRINGTGCVGVAPNVNLMFLKCPNLMSSEVSAAIRYAADNGADIITMSLGMYTYSFTSTETGKTVAYSSNAASLFSSAINYAHGKNCIILASAGNDNTDALSYPACNDYVIGVGALASKSRSSKASYSNYNPSGNTSSSNNNVDVTVCGSVYVAGKDSNTHYTSTQGTSFSCPITAAALALYCQAHSDWTISSAEQALYNTCDDIGGSGWDSTFGYGCVDINELVNISYSVSGVSLDKNTLELYANNDSSTVTATVVPNYATNKTINWTNSDSTVATISSATSTSGNGITVIGKKAGTTTLTARSAEDSSKYATCTVTVESYTSSAFTMDSSASIVVGDTHQISVNWTNGTPTYTDLSYSSSDTSVCTVSSTGLITAKAVGTSTITVDSIDEQHTMAVTVVAEAPGDYVLVTDASTLSSGDKILLVNADDSKANGSLYNPGSSTYLTAEDVTITNSRISTVPSGVAPITLGGSSGAWTLTINGSTTLYADGSNFYSTSGSGRSSTYTLSISNSAATLKASGASNPIKYNHSSPRFKPYSGQNDIQIYKKESGSSGGVNYTVTFNSNGGTGTMSSQTTSGSSYTTPSCTFTHSGYTCSKWALNSVGGTQYTVGQTITNISANITLYAIWSSNSASVIDDDYGNYYQSITSDLTGGDLLTALHTLNSNKRVRTMGYDGLKTYGKYTEQDWTGTANVSGKMFGFYDNALIADEWDNQATWNREHVWPNSHGGGEKGDTNSPYVDADMHMTRPASVSINSSRGNSFYGNSLYDAGQYVADYRGIAARIIFYCAIADTQLEIVDQNDGNGHQMGKLSDLLKWNLDYAPDKLSTASLAKRIEANRNKEIYSRSGLQGNRNPFVDHPEYACKIWGNTNAATRAACGYSESITLSQSSGSLETGDTLTLTATTSGGSGDVTWVTSNSTVASLSTNTGNSVTITAGSAGSATITATYGSASATCTITVTSSGGGGEQTGDTYTKVTSAPSDWSGEYLVSYDNESTAKVWTGVDSANCYTTATISNNKIEKPDGAQTITIASMSGGYSVKVNGGTNSGKYIGGASVSNTISFSTTAILNTISYSSSSVDITSNTSHLRYNPASSNDRFRYFKSATYDSMSEIQLYKLDESSTPTPTLSSISLNTDNVTKSFSVGDTFSYTGLVVTGHYSDSSTSPINSGYTVSSPDMSSAGTKTITVSYGGFDATYTITVSNVSVTGVTLNKNSTSITVGSTETLTATITPSNATNKNVTWTSSATSVASVSGGTVTALATGSTTITVRTVDGGHTATCTVTVTAAPTITYQLEADSSEVPFNSGTNHIASVGVKLYQYNNGVKGSVVSSGNVNVDTSSLGRKTVQYTYSSTTYTTTVKVTNHGSAPSGYTTLLNDEFSGGKSYITSSSTWSQSGIGSDYANSHSPYLLKFDDNGDSLTASVNTSSKSIKVQIGVKMIGGNSTSSFTVTAKNAEGSTVGTGTITISGAQNSIQTLDTTISNSDGQNIKSIVLSFNKGSNLGLGSVTILVENTSEFAGLQAKAWATYFINETRTAETCLAELDSQKLAGLQDIWDDLAYEYTEMIGDSKDEFCTSNDSTIVAARNHYLFIVSKFGASNLGTDGAFVKNSSNQVLQAKQYNPLTLLSSNSSIPIAVIISVISVSSIGLYFYFKKRREED